MSEDDTSELPPMPTVAAADPTLPGTLELGAFSISLNVADLDVSATFYRALGFEEVGTFADVGFKFDRWHDVAWLHRPLEGSHTQ